MAVIILNKTRLITRIKRELGLYVVATPFENINEFLSDIVQDTTLPVFSQYFPYRELFVCDVKDLQKINSCTEFQEFIIPELGGRPILGIEDVKYDVTSTSGIGYWGGGTPFMSGNMMQRLAMTNAGAQLSNVAMPSLTHYFTAPNRLRLYNLYVSQKIIITYLQEHDSTLGSIPDSESESFYKLAVLDCKMGCYDYMKHYNELSTAHGSINLKIDDWANASQDRDALLDKWDDTFHLDRKTQYFA